jgi:hypothetical protein
LPLNRRRLDVRRVVQHALITSRLVRGTLSIQLTRSAKHALRVHALRVGAAVQRVHPAVAPAQLLKDEAVARVGVKGDGLLWEEGECERAKRAQRAVF